MIKYVYSSNTLGVHCLIHDVYGVHCLNIYTSMTVILFWVNCYLFNFSPENVLAIFLNILLFNSVIYLTSMVDSRWLRAVFDIYSLQQFDKFLNYSLICKLIIYLIKLLKLYFRHPHSSYWRWRSVRYLLRCSLSGTCIMEWVLLPWLLLMHFWQVIFLTWWSWLK